MTPYRSAWRLAKRWRSSKKAIFTATNNPTLTRILCIETSTRNCSVALSVGGHVVASREDRSAQYSHAEQLHTFIDEVVKEAHLGYRDLDAIAVSKGPGSYTGLRIGVSAAKGLAYALEAPMIAVDPLQSMAALAADRCAPGSILIPMIDARRMEVFCAGFSGALEPVFDTRAEIVDEESFAAFESSAPVYYFGDGAAKCRDILDGRGHFHFLPDIDASSLGMAGLAHEAFAKNDFVDTAYFEPFYLKDFVAGKPKKTRA